jgi:hypothetical protein
MYNSQDNTEGNGLIIVWAQKKAKKEIQNNEKETKKEKTVEKWLC